LKKVGYRDLFSLLARGTIFARGLPNDANLQRPPIACIFSDVLRNGSIFRPDSAAGKDALGALRECFHNGWLHAEKSPKAPNGITYTFASELHSLSVEWRLWDTPGTIPSIQLNSILQFALKVIARFSPRSLSAERRIGPGCIQKPPEAQYQEEFYRSCHAFSDGSLRTLPEYGTAEGRVDFYVPSKKWGVELLRDGNRLEQHSSRFSESGAYERTLPLSDYILLDFRKTRPKRQHLGMCIIYPSIHFTFCQANLTHRHSKIVPRCIQQ